MTATTLTVAPQRRRSLDEDDAELDEEETSWTWSPPSSVLVPSNTPITLHAPIATTLVEHKVPVAVTTVIAQPETAVPDVLESTSSAHNTNGPSDSGLLAAVVVCGIVGLAVLVTGVVLKIRKRRGGKVTVEEGEEEAEYTVHRAQTESVVFKRPVLVHIPSRGRVQEGLVQEQ